MKGISAGVCTGCQRDAVYATGGRPGPCTYCGCKVARSKARSHKYGAQACVVDGVKFPSKREARRWAELLAMQAAGTITDLRRQVAFELHAPGGGVIGKYVADAVYVEGGIVTVEDAKGVLTAIYRWKKKHMLLEHGIKVREV